jgi:GTP-binding protein EngB required for normal cell division
VATRAETAVPVENIAVRRRAAGTVAVVGNPNAGKSSVFNRLTGLRQRTANYPGVTVERRVGRGLFGKMALDLIDLPGTYSLSPTSTDEQIAVDVLFGRVVGTPLPDAVLAVIDATRLYQGLYLLQQLVELGRPMIVALTMIDAAEHEQYHFGLAGRARRGSVARSWHAGGGSLPGHGAQPGAHRAGTAARGTLAGAAPRRRSARCPLAD